VGHRAVRMRSMVDKVPCDRFSYD